ncbi:MAG: hypothetical protein KKD46_01360, partial [Euryarchaeota archaeon]|nr:hypothetical protein [Euryarchaeota archaeon]MBU4339557.1 hypothetical protein [Euryarchaeota archaeon]MCG2737060.1 hypothetical protein [Candidatus Methanoperedenaceae archaeon]
MKFKEYIPFIGMGFMLLLVQLIALALAGPFKENNIEAFSNPEDPGNVVVWVAIILIFTAFIFLLIKLDKKWIIQAFIFLTVGSTLYFVFIPFFSIGPYIEFIIMVSPDQALNLGTVYYSLFILSAGLTVLLYKYPEWYVVDTVGVIIGAGASTMFGISLEIIPTLLLLVVLAVYDYIAVYRTKHMVALAEGVMDLKLPILLVVPKHWKYSFISEKFDKEKREAFFMGLGDAVMPTLLVVSANVFVQASSFTVPFIGSINLPALGAIVGTFV